MVGDKKRAEPVGFFALKQAPQNASSGEIITWDSLTTDVGDGFSLFTNTFTCPIGGIYYFTFSLYNNGVLNEFSGGSIVLDGIDEVSCTFPDLMQRPYVLKTLAVLSSKQMRIYF